MILYHFTAIEYLESIEANGINRGEVALSPTEVINGAWFTTNSEPQGHGLTDGAIVDAESLRILNPNKIIPDDMRKVFPDKRCIRIKVKIPSTDRDLVHWPRWGKRRLTTEWFNALNAAGGAERWQADSWYICFRTVKPSEFLEVKQLRESLTPRLSGHH